MIFKQLGSQSFTYKGVEIRLDYDGPGSAMVAEFIQCEIMPLLIAAPEMAHLLRRIVHGDFPGFPTILDDTTSADFPYARALRMVKDEAVRLAPRKKKKC